RVPLAQTYYKAAYRPPKALVEVDGEAEGSGGFEGDEAVEEGAQCADGVDGVVTGETAGGHDCHQYADGVAGERGEFGVVGVGGVQREGVEAGALAGEVAVGDRQGHDGVLAGAAHRRAGEAA